MPPCKRISFTAPCGTPLRLIAHPSGRAHLVIYTREQEPVPIAEVLIDPKEFIEKLGELYA